MGVFPNGVIFSGGAVARLHRVAEEEEEVMQTKPAYRRLWELWVRHGLLTQDRGIGESPLRH